MIRKIIAGVSVALFIVSAAALSGCSAPGKAPDSNSVPQVQSDTASGAAAFTTPRERLSLEAEASPEWVTRLGAAKDAKQLFIVAGYENSTAWISMHEKDAGGSWKMILSTPGYIGREGLGKTREGDAKTPVGTFSFNKAFGLADDPGCALPYTKADEDIYWSGDENINYNQMVNIKDHPELDTDKSEHIVDYKYQYQYCLNISYNEEGKANAGSAIFLHCFGDKKPYTGGCVAIPEEQMYYVMQHVDPGCVVVIDSMKGLGAEF